MAVTLIVVLLIGFYLSIVVALSSAFREGLDAASAPDHRVTPANPWKFFLPVALRRSRFVCIPVIGLLGMSAWSTWYITGHAGNRFGVAHLHGIAFDITTILVVLANCIVYGLWRAPKSRSSLTLTIGMAIFGLFFTAMAYAGFQNLIPVERFPVQFEIISVTGDIALKEKTNDFFLFGLCTLAFLGLAIFAVHLQGPRWFRFEE